MRSDEIHSEQLWKRRIAEAHFYHTAEKVELLRALKNRLGGTIGDVVAETAALRARREWRTIGEKCQERSLETFIQCLWTPLLDKGFSFDLEWRPDGVQVTCTRCPIADMARALGDGEWLFHLACGIDEAIAEGFNPAIGLRRTRTLMEGHDCCNHFYFMRKTGEPLPE
jgi:predicted ArsR family transcriptional regulator